MRVKSIDRIITSVKKQGDEEKPTEGYDGAESLNFGEMTGSIVNLTNDNDMEMTGAS